MLIGAGLLAFFALAAAGDDAHRAGESVLSPMIDRAVFEEVLPRQSSVAPVSGIEFLHDQTTLKLGGYVKLDSIFDFQDAGNRFSFDPNTIPVDNARGEQFTMHARQTRLNLEAITETTQGQLRLFVEGDFFGAGNSVRMRHAYGEFENLLAGQTWTLTGDPEAFPETLDFGGADGNGIRRVPQVRWTSDLRDDLIWATSLQQSKPNLITTIDGEVRDRLPLFATSLRRKWHEGHWYLSGAVGETRFASATGTDSTTPVWAATAFFVQQMGPDKLILQYGIGEGFAQFLATPLDDVTSSAEVIVDGDQLVALLTQGAVAAYQHVWNSRWRSNASYRFTTLDNAAIQADDAIHANHYFATNLIMSPLGNKQLDIGIEYLWGLRENKDRASSDAHRLQLSVIYRLP